MAAIKLEFTPWRPFHARKNDATIRSWLESVAKASEAAFKKGASRQWPGGDAKGSSPGEWPMRRSGNLISTIGTEVGGMSMTIGSSARRTTGRGFDYSRWLRDTGRKMSPEALEEGMKASQLGRWVEWSRL